MKELIKKLNELKITQTKGDWAENLPDDIWNEHFKGKFKEIAHGIDVDTHRWYETSTIVIDISGELIGISYITNMFSESQDYEDCYVTMVFFEMEEVKIVSYKSK